MANNNSWPYPSEIGKTTHMEADVLVLGRAASPAAWQRLPLQERA